MQAIAQAVVQAPVVPIEAVAPAPVAAAGTVVVAAAAVAVNPCCSPLSAEKKTMKFKNTIQTLAVALVIGMAPAIDAAQPSPTKQTIAQKSFATPEDAAKALAEAVRAEDVNALLTVVGQDSRSWLASGDAVADRADWQKFLAAYDQKNSIKQLPDGRATLLVGDSDWPFPAPLVRKGDAWVFDAAAGREELINRRIGRNELDAIQTLLAIVDAQREYAVGDLDGNGWSDYAQRFASSEGTRDGLFWPVGADQQPSPLGPLFATATREGYLPKANAGEPSAYHGYRYRILSAQGKDAAGGAFSYLVNGRMIGGFAVVAWPAKYDVSGIMTFIVNHDGAVYQKNLGKNTEAMALRMSTFNPDPSWQRVE